MLGTKIWRQSWDFLGDFGGEGIWMKLGHHSKIFRDKLLGMGILVRLNFLNDYFANN